MQYVADLTILTVNNREMSKQQCTWQNQKSDAEHRHVLTNVTESQTEGSFAVRIVAIAFKIYLVTTLATTGFNLLATRVEWVSQSNVSLSR